MKDSVLYKKVLGCLVGGACGDALGGPVEGMNANFIRQLHSGRVTEMVSYRTRPDDFFQPEMPSAYAWHDTPGTYTDDTYFSIQNALCIIQKGGRINCEDLADFWVKNFDVNRAWFSTANSYHKLELTHLPARDVGEGTIGENSSGALAPLAPSTRAIRLKPPKMPTMWSPLCTGAIPGRLQPSWRRR